jgi:hypothetical protein
MGFFIFIELQIRWVKRFDAACCAAGGDCFELSFTRYEIAGTGMNLCLSEGRLQEKPFEECLP